jgi:phospholipase/lecithinase/hemolysin
MKYRHIFCAAAASLLCSSGAFAYTSIEAIGDSLSDNGNLYALTQAYLGTGVPVSPPYYNGRFSNGPVAVEVMASTLGLKLDDYAYGGAQTGTTNLNAALNGTGIQAQVAGYVGALNSAGVSADANALYFLWGGPNDIFANVTSTTVSATAAANMAANVTALYNAGARDFFVPLMPDLSLTPWATQQDATTPGAKQAALDRTNEFNTDLTNDLNALAPTLTGADIKIFDTVTVQRQATKLYAGLGYDTTDPCLNGDYTTGGTVCANPDKYLFWDSVHPTAFVHASLGGFFADAVPEPSTYAVLAVGLVGIAVGARRRNAKDQATC